MARIGNVAVDMWGGKHSLVINLKTIITKYRENIVSSFISSLTKKECSLFLVVVLV